MKRIASLILCLVLLLSLTACGAQKSNEPEQDELNSYISASDIIGGDQMHVIVGGNGEIMGGNISVDNSGETVEDPYKPEVEETHVHDWMEATCLAPMTCSICGVTEGDLGEHRYSNSTCTELATCEFCGKTTGDYADHYGNAGTCTQRQICLACGAEFGDYQHMWIDANCIHPRMCWLCKITEGEMTGHKMQNGECIICGHRENPDVGGDDNGGSNSDATISFTLTSFPADINYGTIQSATYEISGDDLILHINLKRNSLGGSNAMTGYYRISNGSFKTVATGSFQSGSLDSGETVTITVTIADVITSDGTYYVFLSRNPTEW